LLAIKIAIETLSASNLGVVLDEDFPLLIASIFFTLAAGWPLLSKLETPSSPKRGKHRQRREPLKNCSYFGVECFFF